MTGWLEFDVYGLPAPQGSKRAFVRNGRANLVEVAGESLTIWRHSVTAAARKVIEVEAWEPIREGPIEVHVLFWLPRPKSRQVDVWHATRPDIDKLARATLDALTASFIAIDDNAATMAQASEQLKQVSLQMEGKKRMSTVEFLRGFKIGDYTSGIS